MSTVVNHHFRCRHCGYDLYMTPLDGRCPECGSPVPKREGLAKSKSSRRVNAQHRALARRARRSLWWLWPATVLPIAVVVASFWRPIPGWITALAFGFGVSGAIGVFEQYADARRALRQLVPEDDERG